MDPIHQKGFIKPPPICNHLGGLIPTVFKLTSIQKPNSTEVEGGLLTTQAFCIICRTNIQFQEPKKPEVVEP